MLMYTSSEPKLKAHCNIFTFQNSWRMKIHVYSDILEAIQKFRVCINENENTFVNR